MSPILDHDSAGYIAFAAYRTAGYPLFIRLVGLDNVVLAQMALLGISAGLLGRSVTRYCGKSWFGILTVVAIYGNPLVVPYIAHVRTEILFISLVSLFLAAALMYLRKPSTIWAICASVCVGLACITRPQGYPLIIVLGGLKWLA